MSIKLISSIFDIDFKKSSLKFILISMADNATDDGYCYPSIPTISRKCSLTQRFVFMALKELENMGYLKRKKRVHKNKRSRSNEYWISILPTLNNVQGEGEHCSGGRVNTVQGEGEHCSGGRVNTVHPSKENRHIEPSIKHICECEQNKYNDSNPVESRITQAEQIFEYWKLKSKRMGSKLDKKRKSAIDQTLKNFSFEEIQNAVDGCFFSEYHNLHGFNDIELICRNSLKTEHFIEIFKNPSLGQQKNAQCEESPMIRGMRRYAEIKNKGKTPWTQ